MTEKGNSSRDSSEEDKEVYGFHEEWDCDETSSNEWPNQETSDELERYKKFIAHLKWHLEMYRQALLKSPNGQSFLKDTLETFEQNPQEGCTECIIDSLHATISELELKCNKYKSLLSSVTSTSKVDQQ